MNEFGLDFYAAVSLGLVIGAVIYLILDVKIMKKKYETEAEAKKVIDALNLKGAFSATWIGPNEIGGPGWYVMSNVDGKILISPH